MARGAVFVMFVVGAWVAARVAPAAPQTVPAPPATAQDANQPGAASREPGMGDLYRQMQGLVESTRKFTNWDEQYDYMIDAAERIYERNEWFSEPDLFSLDLAREVAAIPPWEFERRFEAFSDQIGARYLLDEGQMATLQSTLLREAMGMFQRNGRRIMEYAPEIIETRASGRPFTAEQVARWSRLGQPVLEDATKTFNRATRDFMQELDPEQRELVQADLDAANNRVQVVERMSREWARGEWDPAQWGLEDDPIQNGLGLADAADEPDATAAAARAYDEARVVRGAPPRDGALAEEEPGAGSNDNHGGAGAARPGATPLPTREPSAGAAAAEANDPWAPYVRAFIAKFHLNEPQRQKAWMFHKDALKRADAAERRRERLAQDAAKKYAEQAETRAAAVAEADKQLASDKTRLFDHLRSRLERLPTRAQRRSATAGELPDPTKEPEAAPSRRRARP